MCAPERDRLAHRDHDRWARRAIVWSVGAEGDGRLHGFDGDTGAEVYAAGPQDGLGDVARFQSPIVTGGRLFVATGTGQGVHALTNLVNLRIRARDLCQA